MANKGRKGNIVTLGSIKDAIERATNNTELAQAFGKLALISASMEDFQTLAQAVAIRKAELAKVEEEKAVERVKAEQENETRIVALLESIICNVFGTSPGELFRKVHGFPKIGLVLKHLECGARAAQLVK